MATTKFDTNDKFKLDDGLDFDFDGFGADPMAVKDDRTPTSKVRDGAVRGAKEYVRNPQKVLQFMRNAMPSGYGAAYDIGRESVEEVQSLYNTVRETTKPAVRAVKNITGSALPLARGILPAKMYAQLQSLTSEESEYSYQQRSEEEETTARLESVMGDIFTAQKELDDQRDQREQYTAQLTEGINQIRHKGQMEQLDQIRKAVQSLSSYQDRVLVNYQKRSLELQYRQYWATAELVKTQKQANKELVEQGQAIVKNTALPDYAKLNNKEAFLDQSRNKFVSDVRDSLFAGGSSYVRQFGENARKQISGMLNSFVQGFQMVDSVTSPMLQGVGEEDQGFGGPSPEEMLGEMGASEGMDYLSVKAGNKLRKKLRKNKTIDRMDSRLGYGANNFATMANDFLTNPEKSWRRGEGIRNTLARFAPASTTDTNLELPLVKDMQKARQFNYQDSKSLNEIIPGLLARIHREVRMFRTGDESTPLLTYDFTKNRFSNDKEITSGLRKRFGEGSRAAGDIDKILKDMDRGGSLSDEQRAKARSVLVNRTLKREDMTATALASSNTWGGGDDAEAIAGMFSRYMRVKDGKIANSRHSFRRANNLQGSIKNAVSQVGDSFEFVQEMVNLGQYEMLLRSGVVNDRGQIDLEAMGRLINGDEVNGTKGDLGETFLPNAKGGRGNRTVNIDKSSFKFDTSGFEKSMAQTNTRLEGLGDKLGQGTDNRRLESIDETLQRIEGVLLHLDEVGVAHYQHVGGDEGVKSYSSLTAHLAAKAREGVEALGRGASALGSGIMRGARGARDRVAPLVGWAKGATLPRLGRLKNKLTGFFNSDVFVGLETKPRIMAAVLKAGGYVDAATNKVITNIKDIKGDIKDLEGNIVLRMSEFDTAYISGELRKRFTDFLGTAWKMGANILDSVKNFVPNALQSVLGTGRKALNAIRGALPPYDVYVKGDEEPTLYASLFRMGKYRSRKTGKVIMHPREIDDEVIDTDDNVVLTNDQIKRGLIDVRGGKVGSIASRIFARVKDPVANTLKSVLSFGTGAISWVTSKVRDGAAFVKNLLAGKLDIGIYSKRTGDILEEIRDFMYSTWGKKARVVGDMNGDGIRDNSLEDIARKRKEEKASGKGKEEEQNGSGKSSLLSRFTQSISGIFEKFRGKKDKDRDDEDDDDDDGFGLSDAADAAEIADAADEARDRRKGRKGRKGKRGKASRRTRAPSRLGRKGLGQVAKRGGIRGAAGQIAKRGMFSTFMPRMLGRLGIGGAGMALSGASAAIGGGGALASGLGMAGSALGALVSWPGLIAGGTLYGGYLIYKKLKETKLTPLSRVRLAQYGIPDSEAEMVKKVFALENMLQEKVKFDNDGWATVDRNDLEQKDLADLFGLKTTYQAQRFISWYDSRFAPVYLRALSQMKQMKVEAPNLRTVESQIEAIAKEKYMDAVIDACQNYHTFMKGPPGFLKLEIGHEEVMNIANEQRIALKRMEKAETGKTAAFVAPESTKQLLGRATSEQANLAADNPNDYEVKDKDGNVLKNLTRDEIAKAAKDGATITALVEVPKNVLLADPTRLDALTCIRYKTYGLKSMMMDKVQALMGLEALCMKYVKFSKTGSEFSAKSDQILLQCATVFGKENTTGKNAQDWKTWFNERFLPTFMPFIGALYKLTNSTDYIAAIKKLTPAQQLKIANMLTGSAGVDSNRVAASVWEIDTSPWIDYELGTNPDVVISNLETIKALVAKIELQEPLGPDASGKDRSNNASIPNADINKPAIFTRGARNRTASASAASSRGMMATGDVVLGTGEKMSRLGEAMQISSGNGRKWADLPNPQGSGWAAMKDLIIEAGKATGIDPKILAAYIAVESRFDPNARPDGGKALGLGQHMPGTWDDMMKRYGAALGIPAGTLRTDPRASVLLTAMYLKQNAKEIGKSMKRDVSVAEGYLGHFAGATGATDLLNADPNRIAAEIRPAAARNNPNVFYDPTTKRPYTVREMLEKLRDKLEKRPGELGVKNTDFSGSVAGAGGITGVGTPPAQDAGSRVVAEASASSRNGPQGGFGNTNAAVNNSARPTPSVSANAANIDLNATANLKPSGPPLPATGKIELFLKREPTTDDGTFGTLHFPDGTSLLSLELPWKNNKNGISCIPAGTYKCAKRQTTSFGFAYEVKNVVGRSGILIHAGNSAGSSDLGKKADSAGCILLGQGRGQKGSQKIITSSKAAMKIFHDKMQDREFTLTVTAAPGEEMSQSSANENPTRGNIEKIAAAAPQSPGNLSTPISSTGTTSASDAGSKTATESGMRANLAAMRGPGAATPTNSSSSSGVSFDRGFKPTNTEMAARDQQAATRTAAQLAAADEVQNKLLDSALRREDLLKKLVDFATAKNEQASQQSQAPGKVSANVEVKPIAGGRKY